METNSKWTFTLAQVTKAHRGEQMYSSTLSVTSALDGAVGGRHHAPAALHTRKDQAPIV